MKKKVVKKTDKQEIHFRVIPQKLARLTQPGIHLEPDRNKYRVCLEKGMQVIGKSVPIQIPHNRLASKFAIQKNLFDFQIAFDSKFQYIWSLYRIDQDDYEERIEQKAFLIKQLYDKFISSQQNNYYQKTVDFDCRLSLQFMVLIQNTADYILKLTATILPETTKSHLGPSCLSPSKSKSEKIKIDDILEKGKKMMEQTENNENSKVKQDRQIPGHEIGFGQESKRIDEIQQNQQPATQSKEKNPSSKEQEKLLVSEEEENLPVLKEQEKLPTSEEQQNPHTSKEQEKLPTSEEQQNPHTSKEQEKLPTSEEQQNPHTSKEQEKLPTSEEQQNPPTQLEQKAPIQQKTFRQDNNPAQEALQSLSKELFPQGEDASKSKDQEKIIQKQQKNVGKEDINVKNSMSGILQLDSLNNSDIIGGQNSKLKNGHKIESPIIEEEEMEVRKQQNIQDEKSKQLLNQKHKKYGLIIVIIMLVVGLIVEISVINSQNKAKKKKKNKNK